MPNNVISAPQKFEVISQETLKLARERALQPRKTIFDLDDTGWGLSERVAQKVGVDFADLIDFHILKNERITMEQRLAINDYYRDPEIFRGIEFYPGFAQIMELKALNAVIQVNSNSLGEEVRDIKIKQTLSEVPGLRREHLRFGLVNENTTIRKRFDDDTYILVDDSPYNIAISPATWNIVPRKPWNQTKKAAEIMRGKSVIFVPPGDFYKIIRTIANILCPAA